MRRLKDCSACVLLYRRYDGGDCCSPDSIQRQPAMASEWFLPRAATVQAVPDSFASALCIDPASSYRQWRGMLDVPGDELLLGHGPVDATQTVATWRPGVGVVVNTSALWLQACVDSPCLLVVDGIDPEDARALGGLRQGSVRTGPDHAWHRVLDAASMVHLPMNSGRSQIRVGLLQAVDLFSASGDVQSTAGPLVAGITASVIGLLPVHQHTAPAAGILTDSSTALDDACALATSSTGTGYAPWVTGDLIGDTPPTPPGAGCAEYVEWPIDDGRATTVTASATRNIMSDAPLSCRTGLTLEQAARWTCLVDERYGHAPVAPLWARGILPTRTRQLVLAGGPWVTWTASETMEIHWLSPVRPSLSEGGSSEYEYRVLRETSGSAITVAVGTATLGAAVRVEDEGPSAETEYWYYVWARLSPTSSWSRSSRSLSVTPTANRTVGTWCSGHQVVRVGDDQDWLTDGSPPPTTLATGTHCEWQLIPADHVIYPPSACGSVHRRGTGLSWEPGRGGRSPGGVRPC